MSTFNVTQLDFEPSESIYTFRALLLLLSDQVLQLMESGKYEMERSEITFILSEHIIHLFDSMFS